MINWLVRWSAGVSLFALASSPSFAEPQPRIAPVPGWVAQRAIPTADAKRKDAPFQFLLGISQVKLLSDGLEDYHEYAAIPQTTAGLQDLGTIQLPWNVERHDMTLHKIEIRRGSATIDLLKSSDLLVLRRENNLEKATLDGVRTVVLPAQGLQVGDVLSVAFSYKSKPQSFSARTEEFLNWSTPVPIGQFERRFLVPDGLDVRWKASPSVTPVKTTKLPGATEHLFAATNLEAVVLPKFVPGRFKTPSIQVSAFRDWDEVGRSMIPLYDKARALAPGSALNAEAARIAAASPDPGQRMMSALRLAQEQVRYIGLFLGDGAYVPASADQTWQRKFGDCKGKTALLLALLDRLGIAAEPMLASVQLDDGLGERLPSLAVFDHVLVRAMIGGTSYYLDATDYGQRTLEELASTHLQWGLPLHAGSKLEALPPTKLSAPTREVELVWDTRTGLLGEVPYTAELRLRGAAAAYARAKLASMSDPKEFEKYLKDFVPRVENDGMELIEKIPDAPDGSFVARFTGKQKLDWSPIEGMPGPRFNFDQSTIKWDVDFERKTGPHKDLPVTMTMPYWERTRETLLLPASGKGFVVDAVPFNRSLIGVEIARNVTQSADKITAVSDFKRVSGEFSAEAARAAATKLEENNDDFAYVVAPKKLVRPPKR